MNYNKPLMIIEHLRQNLIRHRDTQPQIPLDFTIVRAALVFADKGEYVSRYDVHFRRRQ